MTLGRLTLRLTVGGLMMGHGLQKLKGSFGGPGLEATARGMDALGLHPARHQAWAAGLSETVGGALTAAGFLSPLGPAMVIGVMGVAIHKVHWKNGVWVTSGGFEYNLTLIAASFLLATEGPGAISLDRLAGRHRAGLRWGLASLALGLGTAAATVDIAQRMAPREDIPSGGPGEARSGGAQETPMSA